VKEKKMKNRREGGEDKVGRKREKRGGKGNEGRIGVNNN
jgi:hypothetical protein